MSEVVRAQVWLTETLSTPEISGVKHVSEHPLPQGLADPYPSITFALMSPDDLVVLGEDRVWSNLVYLVTAVAKGESVAAIESIADEVDRRLHKVSGEVDGAYITSSVRVSPFSDSQVRDGVSYRRLGGMYELLVQAAEPIGS